MCVDIDCYMHFTQSSHRVITNNGLIGNGVGSHKITSHDTNLVTLGRCHLIRYRALSSVKAHLKGSITELCYRCQPLCFSQTKSSYFAAFSVIQHRPACVAVAPYLPHLASFWFTRWMILGWLKSQCHSRALKTCGATRKPEFPRTGLDWIETSPASIHIFWEYIWVGSDRG